MVVVGIDPGETSGVVVAGVSQEGIRVLRTVTIEGYQRRASVPVVAPRAEVAIELPPRRPTDPLLPRRFQEFETSAFQRGHGIFRYRPVDWKPSIKRLGTIKHPELSVVHLRDAYGLVLHHLRSRHATRYPFLKEDGWHLPRE